MPVGAEKAASNPQGDKSQAVARERKARSYAPGFLLLLREPGFAAKFAKNMRFRPMSGRNWPSRRWDRPRIEPFADRRDITGLGHCNFQFYDNAAGHYFSWAALLVCRPWHSGFAKARSRRQSTSSGQQIAWGFGWAGRSVWIAARSRLNDRGAFGAMFANGCPWRAGYCHAA
jgi:hypothetical protein